MYGVNEDEYYFRYQARVEGWDEEPEPICAICHENIPGRRGYYDKDIGWMCVECADSIAWEIIEDEKDQILDDKHAEIMDAWEVPI